MNVIKAKCYLPLLHLVHTVDSSVKTPIHQPSALLYTWLVLKQAFSLRNPQTAVVSDVADIETCDVPNFTRYHKRAIKGTY